MMQGCCTPPPPHGTPACLSRSSSCLALLFAPSSWVFLFGLVPPPPVWGRACSRFGWPGPACGRPRMWPAVCSTEVRLQPLVSVIVTYSLPCCPFPLANGAPVPALMRLSLILHRPPSGLREFDPGWAGPLGGDGGRAGDREHNTHTHRRETHGLGPGLLHPPPAHPPAWYPPLAPLPSAVCDNSHRDRAGWGHDPRDSPGFRRIGSTSRCQTTNCRWDWDLLVSRFP